MRPITAADLMNPEVLTVREDMPVEDLARFLIGNEISGAPVESAEGRLVGVVSLHDVVALVVEDGEDDEAAEATATSADAEGGADEAVAAGLDPAAEMAAEPGTVGPDEGAEDGDLPDDDSSDDDSSDAASDDLADGFWDDVLVEDIMTPKVVSVSELATVPEIASLMLKEHLHRLLVVEDGEPRGIISTSDLLGLLVEED